MDLSDLTVAGWPLLARLGDVPEAVTGALVSAVATLALLLFFAPRLPIAGGRRSRSAPGETAACDFLINGAGVKPLTEPARALLESLDPHTPKLAALSVHLSTNCPALQPDLEALVLYGAGFRHHCPTGNGTAFEIIGEPRGGAAFLSVRTASEEARALRESETELARSWSEVRFLRDLLDHAPVLAWSHGPHGLVTWANAPYRDRFDAPGSDLPDHRIADAFGHVLEEVPLTARGGEVRRRVSVPARDGSEPQWFELSETAEDGGEGFGFALPADDLVGAEAALRRFVETLTETFAHLPIGLAVFDKNRRLGLFNPALTDLVKIDAVWLAGRPSLRDFLERLRETRQMPEQKDFASWRRKLSELEEGAREGTYEENWQLPSGKILRVTGRPHPQGALAFLFEDISTAIILERRYRSELELSQATLDRMSEAVAVFDASGMLVFVNSAFEALWGLEPMARLDGPEIAVMASLWAERCAPSTAWARLTEFTTGADARTSWTDAVVMHGGRRLEMLVAPLPDTSALVVFRHRETAAAVQPALAATLAVEALRDPVEGLLATLAGSPDAAAAGAAIAADIEALRQGLARAEALAGGAPGDPLGALVRALAARGHALEITPDTAGWEDPIRLCAVALALACADVAAPGASLALSRGENGRLTLTAAARQGGTPGQTFGVALARRVIEAAGGTLRLGVADGIVTLAAEIPVGAGLAQAARRA